MKNQPAALASVESTIMPAKRFERRTFDINKQSVAGIMVWGFFGEGRGWVRVLAN